MTRLLRTDSTDANFRELVKLLDAELSIRDGAEHAFYAQFNKLDAIRNVVVAYIDDEAVGCGAFKKFDEKTAEIKRMYVREDRRGKGIAKLILKELETWTREEGFEKCVLETGHKQPEAIALYKGAGYETIPNYGQYAGVYNSICMQKKIG
jgi:GNAT superfamily N-acetyltransferase